ncbi:hypothetical protein K6V98_04150 [Collinsella sp. AGMB00827]|uniref:PqqD family protein n=1 Tax=Collinsella ureilytica TaxID=2869515 RepID=A0ABS7MJK1_9ACTN|nr:hypothetical protein [Collinsella urealyticum]MBY4797547.1 hypothetical protein [Collinsella urealyticum]
MQVFQEVAVLFESSEDGESLRIDCAMTREGGLQIMRVSEGPLTQWCFEESPHPVTTLVDPAGTSSLMEFVQADLSPQLPAVLASEFTGVEADADIRAFLRRLNIGYEVKEPPIVR